MQTRLMNVAQVRVSIDQIHYDLRPNCVEITIRDDHTALVMLNLSESRERDGTFDPIIVGRVFIDARCEVIDALEGNGQTWCVQHGQTTIEIRPFQEESIWVDSGFGRTPPTDLAKLYDERRLAMMSLTAHNRFLRSTPLDNTRLRDVHKASIGQLQAMITGIQKQIADKEATRG